MERELRCKDCDRYLATAYGTIVAEIRCTSSCKAVNQVKIINGDQVSDLRFKFAKPKSEPKKKDLEPKEEPEVS